MEQSTIEKIAFNVIILQAEIPVEDRIATLGEIAVLSEIPENVFSIFIEASMGTLDQSYESWKEMYVAYMIQLGKIDTIIKLNELF